MYGIIVAGQLCKRRNIGWCVNTRACRPIVHGLLFGSMFGTIFGKSIRGSVYLSQSFSFRKPVYVGEQIHARVEVVAVRAKPHIVTCKTTVVKADGDVAVEGDAVALLPQPASLA